MSARYSRSHGARECFRMASSRIVRADSDRPCRISIAAKYMGRRLRIPWPVRQGVCADLHNALGTSIGRRAMTKQAEKLVQTCRTRLHCDSAVTRSPSSTSVCPYRYLVCTSVKFGLAPKNAKPGFNFQRLTKTVFRQQRLTATAMDAAGFVPILRTFGNSRIPSDAAARASSWRPREDKERIRKTYNCARTSPMSKLVELHFESSPVL